jgi:hypothetical protein
VKVTEHPDGTTVVETGRAAKATWDGETITTAVLKSEPERRYTLNVIYPADKADVAVALDGHRDFASKAVVETAAWNYMRKSRDVGVFHNDAQAAAAGTTAQPTGAAEVVESYIYRGPDWAIKGAGGAEVVVKAGDWLGGFVWTPEAWKLIQEGKIGGVSVEGKATRRKASAEAVAGLRS